MTRWQTDKYDKDNIGEYAEIVVDELLSSDWLTNKKLINRLKYSHNIKVNESEIREIIHYIRCNVLRDCYIIAGSKGYKITYSLPEIEKYLGTVEHRLNSIRDILHAGLQVMRRINETN